MVKRSTGVLPVVSVAVKTVVGEAPTWISGKGIIFFPFTVSG
jgi:hypothetical protein